MQRSWKGPRSSRGWIMNGYLAAAAKWDHVVDMILVDSGVEFANSKTKHAWEGILSLFKFPPPFQTHPRVNTQTHTWNPGVYIQALLTPTVSIPVMGVDKACVCVRDMTWDEMTFLACGGLTPETISIPATAWSNTLRDRCRTFRSFKCPPPWSFNLHFLCREQQEALHVLMQRLWVTAQ